MYRTVKSGASPEEHIIEDLNFQQKDFSESANLSASIFLKFQLFHARLQSETSHKSQAELNQLRDAKYNDIYIGLESGCDDVLKQLNKGYTRKDEYETLQKLKNADIEYIALLMGGAGGESFRKRHITDTAELLNSYPPKMISIITTGIASGTELDGMRDRGEFIQLTERFILR